MSGDLDNSWILGRIIAVSSSNSLRHIRSFTSLERPPAVNDVPADGHPFNNSTGIALNMSRFPNSSSE